MCFLLLSGTVTNARAGIRPTERHCCVSTGDSCPFIHRIACRDMRSHSYRTGPLLTIRVDPRCHPLTKPIGNWRETSHCENPSCESLRFPEPWNSCCKSGKAKQLQTPHSSSSASCFNLSISMCGSAVMDSSKTDGLFPGRTPDFHVTGADILTLFGGTLPFTLTSADCSCAVGAPKSI